MNLGTINRQKIWTLSNMPKILKVSPSTLLPRVWAIRLAIDIPFHRRGTPWNIALQRLWLLFLPSCILWLFILCDGLDICIHDPYLPTLRRRRWSLWSSLMWNFRPNGMHTVQLYCVCPLTPDSPGYLFGLTVPEVPQNLLATEEWFRAHRIKTISRKWKDIILKLHWLSRFTMWGNLGTQTLWRGTLPCWRQVFKIWHARSSKRNLRKELQWTRVCLRKLRKQGACIYQR